MLQVCGLPTGQEGICHNGRRFNLQILFFVQSMFWYVLVTNYFNSPAVFINFPCQPSFKAKLPPQSFSSLWSHYGYRKSRALEKGNQKGIQLQGSRFHPTKKPFQKKWSVVCCILAKKNNSRFHFQQFQRCWNEFLWSSQTTHIPRKFTANAPQWHRGTTIFWWSFLMGATPTDHSGFRQVLEVEPVSSKSATKRERQCTLGSTFTPKKRKKRLMDGIVDQHSGRKIMFLVHHKDFRRQVHLFHI